MSTVVQSERYPLTLRFVCVTNLWSEFGRRFYRGSPTESARSHSKNAELAHNIVVGRAVDDGLSPSTTEGSRPGQPYYIKATTGSLENVPSSSFQIMTPMSSGISQ